MSADQDGVSANDSDEHHLFVFVHGFIGHEAQISPFRKILRQKYPKSSELGSKLIILSVKTFPLLRTFDGIELCGKHAAQEIDEKITNDSRIRRISIAGYSCGGLVARYAIGILQDLKRFGTGKNQVTPMVFTTIASPNIGLLYNPRRYRAFDGTGAKCLSTLGQQLMLQDVVKGYDKPIVSLLADPACVFMEALRKFKRRTLYGNIICDPVIPWQTAAMEVDNPYRRLWLFTQNMKYVPGYDPIVGELHGSQKFPKSASHTRQDNLVECTLGPLLRLAFCMKTLLLIASAPVALSVSEMGSWRSHRRINNNENGSDHMNTKYRLHSYYSNGTEPSKESTIRGTPSIDGEENKAKSRRPSVPSDHEKSGHSQTSSTDLHGSSRRLRPNLRCLSRSDKAVHARQLQEEMIKSLNEPSVKWDKFPVRLPHTDCAHLNIVRLFPFSYICDGSKVMQHYVNEVFVF